MNERARDDAARRPAAGAAVAHVVEEVPLADTRALRAEWYGDLEPGAARHRRRSPTPARRGMRAFVALGKGFAWLTAAAGAWRSISST